MTKLLDFLFGTALISFEKSDRERAINLLHANMIYIKELNIDKGDFFTLCISRKSCAKVERLLDKSGIKVYSIIRRGLPFIINKYKKRYGIFLGIILFCFLVWFSGQFVWEIEFSGNEMISDSVVEKQLLDVGFGVGSFIPKADLYTICNEFIIHSDDFSFISVNLEGTKANVELRERKKRDEKKEYNASNLVAKYGGIIENTTVYSGQLVVKKEDVVKAGDLLVSGFCEMENGFEIVKSSGSVYAYVTRNFEVEIPYSSQKKVYTGNLQKKVDIIFFGQRLTLKNQIENSYEYFEEINDRERLVLFDRIKLPLYSETIIHREYKTEEVLLELCEAKKQAEFQMSNLVIESLSDSEILERKTKELVGENSYKLICEVSCLTDIAQEKEIIIEKKTENEREK